VLSPLRSVLASPLRPARRRRESGQTLVEFALVIPLALVMIVGIVEFALAFNALLSINFATREAALVGAEAGNFSSADCVILSKVEESVGAPSNPSQISEVRIYKSTATGTETTTANVYSRSGSMSCQTTDGTSYSVPYTRQGAENYVQISRCNVLSGCGGQKLDHIGVKVTYVYTWHTPLSAFLSWSGNGYTLVKSNAMRMEPIL
jgi:Flp pilus assembly protein TadG